jgi:hypothetical protein
VVQKQQEMNVIYYSFAKRGGHVSQDYSFIHDFIHDFIQKYGKKQLWIARLWILQDGFIGNDYQ